MSFHFCPPSSLFPAESSRNDSHVKFIDQLTLRRIAIHDTLLLVINSVGHIYFPVVGIDRKAVVFGVPKLQKRSDGNTVGFHRHSPNIVIDPVKRIPCTVELDFRRPVAQLELELFLYGESLGVYTVERRCLVAVWAALVTAIRDGPHFVVFVHDQRSRLYADGQFVHDLVRLRVDFQDAVLVLPAVHIDVLAVLHHLFGGTRFHVHVWTFDIAGNLVCLGVDDEDAVVPYLRHIGFLIRQEMDIPG